MNKYKIKSSYQENTLNITNDTVSNKNYWDKDRRRAAEVYQFYVYDYAAKLLKKHALDSIMDVGCGIAAKLKHVNRISPESTIIGIDQDDPISYCERAYDFGNWISEDFECPKVDESVNADVVICSDVIEHLLDPNTLIAYLKKRVKTGGFIILSTPERDNLRGKDCDYSPNPHHIREWNKEEFAEYISSQGLEIIKHEVFYPVKLGFHKLMFSEIIKRLIKGYPLKYNQMIVARYK